MSIINVLIAVDAETIIGTYGTNSNPNYPQQVSDSQIFMITKQSEQLGGNGGGALRLNAETGDIIRWTSTTLSLDTNYTSILYSFQASDTNLIDPPTPHRFSATVPLPNPNNPLHPDRQTIQNYFFQTTVEQPGDVTYHFNFMLLKRDGTVQGYYYWDPYIHIYS